MNRIRCKMCGGTIIVEEGQEIITCEFCLSPQTIAKPIDIKAKNLHNRANALRLANEFDKAINTYETIINENSKDAEAHWGICLCKYGIEYVDDPKTGLKIPTCHRTIMQSILNDYDYKQALTNAGEEAKKLYEEEARRIDNIQKEIISLSQKEERYDVFICYKETDNETKQRTIDSVYAQNIYDKLIDKGYKVFFARITLEDKIGSQYEPIIYAALRSAKVMLVIGSKQENIDAVWVRNEWSRYISFMEEDKDKKIIPCYKDMDAYDLPDELQPYQAIDMSKIGFEQDLVRGIQKIVGNDERKQINSNVNNLLDRISIFLEEGLFEKANEYCEKVLDIDAKNAIVYKYKLMIDIKAKNDEELISSGYNINNNINFKSILKFADNEFKDEFNEIINQRNKYIGEIESQNDLATTYLDNEDYAKALNIFRKNAELNNDYAQCYLGYCYTYGYGVKQDYIEAFKWYKLATDQGNASAQCNM